jgi:hypothetical protein
MTIATIPMQIITTRDLVSPQWGHVLASVEIGFPHALHVVMFPMASSLSRFLLYCNFQRASTSPAAPSD